MKSNKKKNELALLGDDRWVFLENCEVSTKGRIENLKRTDELTKDDQISFTSDVMFKTMLCNSERKMFIGKLLSTLLEVSYDYIMKNTVYYRNELDKDTVHTKGERSDLVLKMKNDYILIEMNMKDETKRNIEYGDKLYRAKILVGKDYIYPEVLTINFNNYYYEGYEREPIQIFHIQTDKGVCLSKKAYVQVYLPLIKKKWYTNGIDELSEFERMTALMSTTNRNEALELAKDDTIMKKYVEEAKYVECEDTLFREAYDHELSARMAEREIGVAEGIKQGIEQGIEQGFKQGMKQGIEQGIEKSQKKIIRCMLDSGKSEKEIAELTGINFDEVEKIVKNIRDEKDGI